MNSDSEAGRDSVFRPNARVPAPCIIDTGTVVNKRDMLRLLADLGRVRYSHTVDGQLQSQGEGYVLEVFADPMRSTLVANRALYLNVCSFDCLELQQSDGQEACFDLIQEGRQLRLIALSDPVRERDSGQFSAASLEALLTQVLCAKLDAEIDDFGSLPF
ncbi:hypothetical protein [Kamptonema formosum]|uniref:hypothetical protein n=1 Tax=Kamptonema formosum TaxID=331992 RepID=UPI0003829D90|nr:hypothetical protein [Oscillatoria sp. PCC 10802]